MRVAVHNARAAKADSLLQGAKLVAGASAEPRRGMHRCGPFRKRAPGGGDVAPELCNAPAACARL